MRCELRSLPRPYALVIAVGLAGAALAGCSREATRGSEDPFSNPFRSQTASRSDMTYSSQAPANAVETRPLPGPAPAPGQSYAPASQPQTYASGASGPQTVPAAPAPNYTPANSAYGPSTTGTVAARPGENGWRWDGGTAVTVQSGETVDILAKRYGVPPASILRANNIADGNRLQPGQRLVIPSYQAGAGNPGPQAHAPSPPRAIPASAPARAPHVHVVNAGETLSSIGRRYHVSHGEIVKANKLPPNAVLRIGQRLTIPGAATTTARAATPARRVEAPVENPRVAGGPAAAETAASVKPAEQAEPVPSLGGSPQFRWPVKGRVISAFGQKPNGQHNDGINLSVPEGTDVKAAESGVVAYAGNELKGYGNLVLVRHADGWVTAYAHNSQILVKRGDTVKRGQNIARAGQTGGVASPQLHFEIRKGSTPVDPAQHLSSL
jgi:murein DD-endopeptidase MepM/ murein hydrolase activator NlpD